MANYDAILDDEERRMKVSQPQTANPYEAVVEEEARARDNRLTGILSSATKVNPDKAAKVNDLSRRSGLPVPIVERNEDQVASMQRTKELREAMSASPVLLRQMFDPEFAKLAHDDGPGLSTVEKAVQWPWKATKAIAAGAASVAGGAYGLAAVPFELASQFVGQPLQRGLDVLYGQPSTHQDLFGQIGSGMRRASSNVADYAKQIADVSPEAGILERGVTSGLQSLGQNIPALAAAVVTGNPMMAIGGLSGVVAGTEYTKAREKGLTPTQSALYGAAQGGVEAVTEKFAWTKFIGDLKVGTPFFKMLINNQVREQPGEQLATVWQDLNEWATLNPTKPFSDYVKERPSAALETAIATLVAGSGTVAISKAMERQGMVNRSADEARQVSDGLNQLLAAAAGSKLRERSPETFRDFVNAASAESDLPAVWVSAQVLQQTLQQSGVDPQRIASLMPETVSQLEEAAQMNRDVRVPTGEFTAALAGTGLEADIIQHLRTDENAPTLAETQEFYQSQVEGFHKEAEAILAESEQKDALRESASKVEHALLQQFETANRFTSDVNTAYARLASSFYTVQAARLNMTPEQMYDKYPLRIAASNVVGEVQLDQPGDDVKNYAKSVIDSIMAKPEFQAEMKQQQELLDFHKDLKGRVGARVAYGQLLARHHDWRFNVGDVILNTETGKTMRVVNRTFTQQGKLKDNVWGPTYWIEQGTEQEGSRGTAYEGRFGPNYQVIGQDNSPPMKFEQPLSTRVPTAVKSTEDALGDRLIISTEAMQMDPTFFEKAVDVISKYVNFPKGVRGKPAAKAEIFIQQAVDNLLWLYDQVPEATRERSKRWYDGARLIVDQWTALYGLSDAQVSGVIAVMSPQKDWFQNVSVAERVLDVMMMKQDTRWDDAMSVTAERIYAKPEFAEDVEAIKGKTLAEVDSTMRKAMWVRAYSETHHTRSYRVITPEGDFTEWNTNADGVTKSGIQWGSLAEIGKAISVIADGSIPNISQKLGENHKVRNFYNNIVDPTDNDHVTIDTHAVAAALLRPLAASDTEVGHNFGTTGAPKSAVFGVKGTYGFYADAYRRAAAQRGVLTREMQLITWEAIRGLFTNRFKAVQRNADAVDSVWARFRKGEVSLDDARNEIVKFAGGINAPQWESRAGDNGESWASTYDSELSGAGTSDRKLRTGLDASNAGRSARRGRGSGELRFEQGPLSNNAVINVGLNVNDGSKITVDDVKETLLHFGITVTEGSTAQSDTEPTFIARLSRALTEKEAHQVSDMLRQDAIAQVVDGVGELHGPAAEAWRPFNPEFFITPSGTRLSESALSVNDLPENGSDKPGSVTVVGVHFSPSPRTSLAASAYGRGMKGAERDRVLTSKDARLRQRVHFYVNTGQGVFPEDGVGAVAHVATLHGLYDANSDPLNLVRDNKDTWESAILDAGFTGYVMRGFGNQGAAVVFEDVDVKPIGIAKDANALVRDAVLPQPVISDQRKLIADFVNDRRLPSGKMTPAEWLTTMEKSAPDLAARVPHAAFVGEQAVYRDEIARSFAQTARGQISMAADITSSPTTITLLQNADLSTFLHELGHFQLEVLSHIASQPDAPKEIVDDLNAIFKWFGVSGLAEWQAMSLEEKRPHHEKFARGFEAYLFEGKAASQQLGGVFARFRAWMLNVYKELRNLDVQLTDEVRKVFDRLLASNEDIINAENARAYAPLFESAKAMGATDTEFRAYQELGRDATQAAVDNLQTRSLRDMAWTANTRSRVIRKMQKDAAEKRKAVRAEVKAEVEREPVYQAYNFLSRGVLLNEDGTTDQAVGAKLSLDALREMYGDGPAAPWRYFNTGKHGLVSADVDGSLTPDAVAEMFGFTSGDHLVRALLEAQPQREAIEGMTDQRMLERYGDLTDIDTISRAANQAIHNEVRGRFIATELRALNDAVNVREDTGRTNKKGRKISSAVLPKAAREFAENLIARKLIREVRPAQYEAAEARAGKAAERALGKNLVEAATEKRNQLVNHYAAKAAHQALEDVEKGVAYLKRIAESESIDIGYREQIQALLERFDLRRVSPKEAAKRKSLTQWVEDQRAMGFEPVIDAALLNEAQRTPIQDTTVEDFRGLVDAVRNIAHLGRLKKRLLNARDKREFDAIVAEASASIHDNAKRTVEHKIERNSWTDSVKEGFAEFFAMHRKFANMIREMDGWKDNGVLWRLFGRGMNEAAAREAVMREEATMQLHQLLKTLGGKFSKKLFIPEINASLSREGRIMVALNTGNDGNLQRLLDGEHWTADQAQAVVNTLTKEEMDFVQSVWDFVGQYRDQIGAQQKRLTGIEPKWVEARPVVTPHGEYKGGYIPAKYDVKRSTRSLSDEAASGIMDQWRAARGSAKARDSFTKERANKVVDRPLRKDFGVITQHVTEVTHRLAWQEFLVDANRLLRAKPIDSAIREHYGPEVLEAMRDTIEDIAAGEVGAQNAYEKGMNYLRTGATIAGLGWRVTTSLLQPIGLTQSMVRIGPKWVGKGLVEWLGDAAKMENTAKRIYGKSEFMRLRGKTMQRELSEIRNVVSGKQSVIEASYFYLIQKMQLVADIPTWLGQYHKSVEAGLDEATAVAQADQAVLDAQGGGQIKDLAGIQRGGVLLKLFTNFYSFFNTTYNMTKESVGRTNFKDPISIGRLAVDFLLLYSVPAVLGSLMKAALSDDKDEDKLIRTLIADQLSYMFGTMVGLREFAGIFRTLTGLTGDYAGPASVRIVSELVKLGKQVNQGEVDEALLKAANNVGGILLHYPAGQINNTLDGIVSLSDGRTSHPGALLVGSSER